MVAIRYRCFYEYFHSHLFCCVDKINKKMLVFSASTQYRYKSEILLLPSRAGKFRFFFCSFHLCTKNKRNIEIK